MHATQKINCMLHSGTNKNNITVMVKRHSRRIDAMFCDDQIHYFTHR